MMIDQPDFEPIMNTTTRGLLAVVALVAASPVAASASGATQVSKQKNVELNSVAENLGNYDSPPVSPPRLFSHSGYHECLVALGSTYCRQDDRHWLALAER
jgi:hypothetical protein